MDLWRFLSTGRKCVVRYEFQKNTYSINAVVILLLCNNFNVLEEYVLCCFFLRICNTARRQSFSYIENSVLGGIKGLREKGKVVRACFTHKVCEHVPALGGSLTPYPLLDG